MRNKRIRCYCMNNNYQNSNNPNVIDTSCNNIDTSKQYNSTCNCGFDDDNSSVFPQNPMLAQSYVPVQIMDEVFKPCVGLKNGTIFPELVSPYSAGDDLILDKYIRQTNIIGEGCNV